MQLKWYVLSKLSFIQQPHPPPPDFVHVYFITCHVYIRLIITVNYILVVLSMCLCVSVVYLGF